MRVLLFLRSLLHGGTERQAVVLACELRKRGHQVRIATLYGGDAFADDLAAADVPHDILGKRGRFDLLYPHLRLVRLARSWSPDVVYSFLPAQNMAAAALSPFFRRAKLLLGVRAANLNLSKYDWLAGLSYRLEPWMAHCADLVIANSAAGKDWCMARGFPSRKLSMIPNGIETDKFRFDDRAREELRAQMGLAEETVLVVNVARLDVMKGHPTFLRAASQLVQSNPDMKFACVGNGADSYKAQLATLAADLGLENRLFWMPAQERVERIFSAADIGVLSSDFGEGFPNTVVEAMACELPMVVTDSGDCRRIVEGLLPVVPPSDPAALAAAIQQAIDMVRMQPAMKSALRQRVEARYSAAALGQATEAAIRSGQ